ncbi:MAG: NAD-dependent dihydropyrimidine dehydrogenase subunit PreA [Planctomycetota bacterium]
MKDLSIVVNGMKFDNPFVIGSGPPGTNKRTIAKSWDEGWGGVVCKTISLESNKVINTIPRYGRLKSLKTGEIIGFENIELISDRPYDQWLSEFRELKKKYPKKILIASVMEEYSKDRWQKIIKEVQECGVDGFELNLSCPLGLPERKMGAAMGQDSNFCNSVVKWVCEVATVPVWAKMTPNITDITVPALAAVESGAVGISAINTILSVIQVDLKTLRPEPSVEGYSVPGGYSAQAVRPIALRMVMETARALPKNVSISGIGGVECAGDAIQFMLLGASTVQVCTGVMLHGYKLVHELKTGLSKFMEEHQFNSVQEFVGKSLPYFTTHADLVQRQKAAKKSAKAGMTSLDNEWSGDEIAEQTNKLSMS